MQILIKSIHFKASATLEKFVTKRVEQLEQLNNRIVRVHVTLSLESDNAHENKVCELLVSIPGEDPYVKKVSASFEEATTMATSAMEKILRRMKPR